LAYVTTRGDVRSESWSHSWLRGKPHLDQGGGPTRSDPPHAPTPDPTHHVTPDPIHHTRRRPTRSKKGGGGGRQTPRIQTGNQWQASNSPYRFQRQKCHSFHSNLANRVRAGDKIAVLVGVTVTRVGEAVTRVGVTFRGQRSEAYTRWRWAGRGRAMAGKGVERRGSWLRQAVELGTTRVEVAPHGVLLASAKGKGGLPSYIRISMERI
jgi:hypothetical protein